MNRKIDAAQLILTELAASVTKLLYYLEKLS